MGMRKCTRNNSLVMKRMKKASRVSMMVRVSSTYVPSRSQRMMERVKQAMMGGREPSNRLKRRKVIEVVGWQNLSFSSKLMPICPEG